MAEEKAVRKKTVKKTARKTVRKTAAKAVAKKTNPLKGRAVQARKAPTEVASRNQTQKQNQLIFMGGLAVVVVMLIVSVVIGVMGQDEIVISDAIETQREGATAQELEKINDIPVQGNKKRLPNGGLTPTPNNGAPAAEPAVDTASTSDSIASSTDATGTTTQALAEEESSIVDEAETDEAGTEENTSAPTDAEIVQ